MSIERMKTMKKENIRIEGHRGTWYIVGEEVIQGNKVYEVESEVWGDEAAHLIVNEDMEVLLDEVYNSFDDYKYHLDIL